MEKEQINNGEQKCEECLAHYTGEHTCPPRIKELVKRNKDNKEPTSDEWKDRFYNRFGIVAGSEKAKESIGKTSNYCWQTFIDFLQEVCAEAYDKGFQDGHAKERWLKEPISNEERIRQILANVREKDQAQFLINLLNSV